MSTSSTNDKDKPKTISLAQAWLHPAPEFDFSVDSDCDPPPPPHLLTDSFHSPPKHSTQKKTFWDKVQFEWNGFVKECWNPFVELLWMCCVGWWLRPILWKLYTSSKAWRIFLQNHILSQSSQDKFQLEFLYHQHKHPETTEDNATLNLYWIDHPQAAPAQVRQERDRLLFLLEAKAHDDLWEELQHNVTHHEAFYMLTDDQSSSFLFECFEQSFLYYQIYMHILELHPKFCSSSHFRDAKGNTLLHWSIQQPRFFYSITELLLHHNPLLLLERNDKGDTPLHLLCSKTIPDRELACCVLKNLVLSSPYAYQACLLTMAYQTPGHVRGKTPLIYLNPLQVLLQDAYYVPEKYKDEYVVTPDDVDQPPTFECDTLTQLYAVHQHIRMQELYRDNVPETYRRDLQLRWQQFTQDNPRTIMTRYMLICLQKQRPIYRDDYDRIDNLDFLIKAVLQSPHIHPTQVEASLLIDHYRLQVVPRPVTVDGTTTKMTPLHYLLIYGGPTNNDRMYPRTVTREHHRLFRFLSACIVWKGVKYGGAAIKCQWNNKQMIPLELALHLLQDDTHTTGISSLHPRFQARVLQDLIIAYPNGLLECVQQGVVDVKCLPFILHALLQDTQVNQQHLEYTKQPKDGETDNKILLQYNMALPSNHVDGDSTPMQRTCVYRILQGAGAAGILCKRRSKQDEETTTVEQEEEVEVVVQAPLQAEPIELVEEEVEEQDDSKSTVAADHSWLFWETVHAVREFFMYDEDEQEDGERGWCQSKGVLEKNITVGLYREQVDSFEFIQVG